jgi:hypothetical protein
MMTRRVTVSAEMLELARALAAIERSSITADQLWSRCDDVLAVEFTLKACIDKLAALQAKAPRR